MELAADLLMDYGVLKVLAKEFTTQMTEEAFSSMKGPGDIICCRTPHLQPGWMILLITRRRKTDPTDEGQLDRCLAKLRSFLLDHAEIQMLNMMELAVNNRAIKGSRLILKLEDFISRTGIDLRVWIDSREPKSWIQPNGGVKGEREMRVERKGKSWKKVGSWLASRLSEKPMKTGLQPSH